MKTILIMVFGGLGFIANGQKVKTQNGIIVFQVYDNLVTDMYFIPSSVSRFEDLFSKNDTVKAEMVDFYSGGCVSENRWLLDTMLKAKELTTYKVEINETNYQDLEYLDTNPIFALSGVIKYYPDLGYIMAKRYKTILFQGNKIVIEIDYYQRFNEIKSSSSKRIFK